MRLRCHVSLRILIFALALSLCLGGVALGDYSDQPDNKHSTLIDKDGNVIRDDEFAGWVKDALIEDGQADVADAKFFFNQCYGGGFLDDINGAMGNTVKWVGGAASKHDETAIGQVSDAENDARVAAGKARYNAIWESEPPFSFWGKQMIDNLDDNETVLKSIDDAIAEDPTGQDQGGSRGGRRTGQSGFGNGGETIRLKDPAVTSHHAILFAGDTDAERHFNTIKGVYDKLKGAWGDPATNSNVTITVLFGDGQKNSKGENLPAEWNAHAATKQGLQNAIAGAEQLLNPNEQFLFYGYDHGGTVTDVVEAEDPPILISPDWFGELSPLLLSVGELEGMALTETNYPCLRLTYHWFGTPTEFGIGDFILNGQSLFTPFNLLPGENTVFAPVPEGWLVALNDLELYNGSGFDLSVLALDFYTFGINDTPVTFVPEPASVFLLGLGGLAMLRRRRRRA